MNSQYQAIFQFVKNETISAHYPSVKMNDSAELLSVLDFVEKMYPNRVILVCQRSETPSVQYASANCKVILGYDARTMMQMSLLELIKLVHPEDLQDVHQCFASINALEPYNPLDYRFEMRYRIKDMNGDDRYLFEEKMVLMNREGRYIYLSSLRDITSEEKFYDVELNIYQRIRSTFKKVQTYIPRQSSRTFTPRQKDIANLIGKGCTNMEIAHKLSVSISTVKNHKSTLFKKAKVKNSIELASITRAAGGANLPACV
jgi:DNA-binding CsgD family transcriptional regulator